MYEKTRAAGFGTEVKRRIMIGTYVLSAGLLRRLLPPRPEGPHPDQARLREAYAAGVDAVLTPATPSAAFGIGEKGSADPVEMYLNDIFTVTVNMAGLPGLAVPAGLDRQGLPLGLQLIGRPFDEETLFRSARSSSRRRAVSRSPGAGGPEPTRNGRLTARRNLSQIG
jgi:aspartyl-tRNA(Asn)/glutamyl-tRNA(Gln) amidotransferase subunit A